MAWHNFVCIYGSLFVEFSGPCMYASTVFLFASHIFEFRQLVKRLIDHKTTSIMNMLRRNVAYCSTYLLVCLCVCVYASVCITSQLLSVILSSIMNKWCLEYWFYYFVYMCVAVCTTRQWRQQCYLLNAHHLPSPSSGDLIKLQYVCVYCLIISLMCHYSSLEFVYHSLCAELVSQEWGANVFELYYVLLSLWRTRTNCINTKHKMYDCSIQLK